MNTQEETIKTRNPKPLEERTAPITVKVPGHMEGRAVEVYGGDNGHDTWSIRDNGKIYAQDCPNCGHYVRYEGAEALYCPMCGHQLEIADAEECEDKETRFKARRNDIADALIALGDVFEAAAVAVRNGETGSDGLAHDLRAALEL